MKRSFKIILIVSLVLNVCFITLKIIAYYSRQSNWEYNVKMKYSKLTRSVNISETKKNFMDSLYLKYPQLKAKKYLFINLWDTGEHWAIKQLPMLDTLIQPILPDFGYVLVNDEKPDYASHIMKRDTSTTKNFLFMDRAGNFIQAINQELRIPRKRYNYPKYPINLILDNTGRIIYFDTLESLSGPHWPEDSLKDKIYVRQLNKAFSELK